MEQKVVLTERQLSEINGRRKRAINIQSRINEVRKKNRNSAHPYLSSVGYPVPGKVPPDGKVCHVRCQNKGCLLNADSKKEIFKRFYSNGNYEMQNTFLLACVTQDADNINNENNRRVNTFKYTLPYNGERNEVCQVSLMHILQIKQKRIRIIQQKLLQGEIFGKDQRGRHNTRPHRLNAYILDLIRVHISSFPTTLSHYKRNVGDPQREYLPPGLNMSKMFRMFVDANPENIRAPFLKDAYCKELKTMALRFSKLRSDTCSECEKLYIAEKSARCPEERNRIRQQTEIHHQIANDGYTQMRNDIEIAKLDLSVTVLCVDLQQVLFSPTLVHKDMFYLRQYSSYNYCIYNTGTDDATICFWNETMATRGSEEMVSCLWRYINANFIPLAENEHRSLILWSDRCSGQNNNYLTIVFAKLLIKRRFFTTVDQKFLSSGHSFLVCDRLFGLIEKQKKICKVFSPEEWITVFEHSRPSNPFHNQVMRREDFLAFDDLLDMVPRPHTLRVSKSLWFRMTLDDMSGILSKERHNSEHFTRHGITQPFLAGLQHSQRASWTDDWLENVMFRVRNEADLPIDAKKYADLMKMLEFLEPQYRDFFRNLPHY